METTHGFVGRWLHPPVQGFIRCTSPLPKNKNGSPRMCINYQVLNKITIKNKY